MSDTSKQGWHPEDCVCPKCIEPERLAHRDERADLRTRLATAEQELDRLKRMFVESTDATKRAAIYEENDRLREALERISSLLPCEEPCEPVTHCHCGAALSEPRGVECTGCIARAALAATAPERDATGQMGGSRVDDPDLHLPCGCANVCSCAAAGLLLEQKSQSVLL